MKKTIITILLTLIMIPNIILADTYTAYDFEISLPVNQSISTADIKVYTKSEKEKEFTETTDDFEFFNKSFYRVENENLTLMNYNETITENETYYVELIGITSKNNNTLGNFTKEGIFVNGGNLVEDKFEISESANGKKLKVELTYDALQVKVEQEQEEIEPVVGIEPDDEKVCLLGSELCCKEFIGLSVCAWIVIGVIIVFILGNILKTVLEEKSADKFEI